MQKAIAAGIPVVAFNAGISNYQQSGALSYFGSDESLAGQTGGKRASDEGFKHVLCVVQFQGQVQLEARCDGVKSTFKGTWTKLYVNGSDLPSVRSTIAATLKADPSIDFVITLGVADRAQRHRRDQGRRQQGQARDLRLQPADPTQDPVR